MHGQQNVKNLFRLVTIHHRAANADEKDKIISLILISFFPVALRPNAGHGFLILEVSRSHTTTHHSR